MKPYYQDPRYGITVYHGDCRELLPELSADVAIADPPYGETPIAWDRCVSDWIQKLVAVPAVWMFGSLRSFLRMARFATMEGWKFSQEVIWEKQNGSGFSQGRFHRVHEMVALWYRGSWNSVYHDVPRIPYDGPPKAVSERGHTTHRGRIGVKPYIDDGTRLVRSVVAIQNEHGQAIHPTQKPVALVELLIHYSCPASGTVLDPFMGSGTTLIAAYQKKRNAIGIEKNERSCELAVRRLIHAINHS